jgi:hypothetical protein
MVVRPAWFAAACVALATVAAVFSLVNAQINPLPASLMSLPTVFLAARAVVRLARPSLMLRLDGDGLVYRQGSSWSSHVRQAFVSPWFIGWRGRGLAGFGVFRGQLEKDQFRRLARTLRQAGLPQSG